jgi:preprotein translocase subunit SecE
MAKVLATVGEDTGRRQDTVPAWKQTPLEFWQFLKDVRSEMHKVVTPSRKEVETTTTVVIVTVFLFAAYFYVVDNVIGRSVQALLHRLSN